MLAGGIKAGDPEVLVDNHQAAAHMEGSRGNALALFKQTELGCATADVDDHVAHGFVNGQVGADSGGHGLFDQLCIGRAGTAGGVGDGATLDLGDG